MLLNEDVNLPGDNSHTDSIQVPGFIHYYNSSDGIFEEQVLVEVERVLVSNKCQMTPGSRQTTSHLR